MVDLQEYGETVWEGQVRGDGTGLKTPIAEQTIRLGYRENARSGSSIKIRGCSKFNE